MKKFTLIFAALTLLVCGCCKKETSSNENTKQETTMNNTMQDLLTRRSVRSYTEEVPSREVIEEICKAGTYDNAFLAARNYKQRFKLTDFLQSYRIIGIFFYDRYGIFYP